MKRRQFLTLLTAAGTASTLTAFAQNTIPNKPIRFIASSAPGTLVDQAARIYAEKMGAVLKKTIVVENVAGAGGLLGVKQILNAPSNSNMILVHASTVLALPHINPSANYSMDNLDAIGEMARAPLLLMVPGSSPYKTLSDLIDAAKSRPGEITFGSSGVGTTNHISVELLAQEAKVQFSHVPYKGISAAIPDVVAGRVDFMMSTATSVMELIKSGEMRALFISSKARNKKFPDVPTATELGFPGASYEIWIGAFAKSGISAEYKKVLADAMEAARNDADLHHILEQAGQEISDIRTPEQFEAQLQIDDKQLIQILKTANLAKQS